MGPYAKWVSEYLDISKCAFDLLAGATAAPLSKTTALAYTIHALSMHAEATSITARLALTYSLGLPAFALSRVRIEQTIVSSYLVHAPSNDGIDPYLAHHPIQVYEVLRKGARYFELDVDLEAPLRSAQEAAASLPGAAPHVGDFRRTWTALKVPQMAERRDQYAGDTLVPWKLSDEYWRLYPLASLAVHGAAETNFWLGELHSPELGSSERYPYLLPGRARAVSSAIARLDILQCAEAVTLLLPDSANLVSPLVERCEREMRRDA